MFIGRIEISRQGYIGMNYGAPDPSKPFLAKIEVHGNSSKTEMFLSPELSDRIVAIIADEVAASGRAVAEAMVAEAMTVAALAAPNPEGPF